MTKIPEFSICYLFTGDIDKNHKPILNKRGESNVEMLPHITMISFTSGNKKKLHTPVVWETDEHGVIKHGKYPVRFRHDEHAFLFPPQSVVETFNSLRGDKWREELADFVAKGKLKQESHVLDYCEFKKSDLRKPKPASGSDDPDKDYRAVYQKIKDEVVPGFVLSRSRTLFVGFSDAAFKDATISVWLPNQDYKAVKEFRTKTAKTDGEISGAVVCGKTSTLPAGIYTIKIESSKLPFKSWNTQFGDVGKKTYYIKEYVDFGITTPAGDFGIIQCDPISLEETMLVQFAKEYSHVIEYKSAMDMPKTEEKEIAYKEMPDAIKTWASRIKTGNKYAKMAAGIADADTLHGLQQELIDAAYVSLLNEEDDSLAAKSLRALYGGRSVVQAWEDLHDTLKNEWINYIIKEKPASKPIAKMYEFLRSGLIEEDKLTMAAKMRQVSIESYDWNAKHGTILDSSADKALRKRLAGKVKKAAKVVGYAYDIYSLVDAGIARADAAERLTHSQKTLTAIAKDYHAKLVQVPLKDPLKASLVPSRMGIGNLEKHRSLTVTNLLEEDKATWELICQVTDIALGVLTVIPLTAPVAGAVVAVKAVGSEVISLCGTGRDLYGSLFENLYFAQLQALEEFKKSHDNAAANMRLLREAADANTDAGFLEVQFRLRAHALYGLYGLLTRAALSAAKENDRGKAQTVYEAKLLKYRVREYIDNFILNDGWFFVYEAGNLQLDIWWIYALGVSSTKGKRVDEDPSVFNAKTGRYSDNTTRYMDENTQAIGSFSSWWSHVYSRCHYRSDISTVAEYQKLFPIHYQDAGMADFAKDYRTAFYELDDTAIVYSSIFYREKSLNPEDPNKKNLQKGWRCLASNTYTAKEFFSTTEVLNAISPLAELRVLIVLNPNLKDKGPYPVNLQLVRTDGWNVEGPVYKGLTRTLAESDFSGDFTDEPAKKYKDCLGAEFYPFYQVGDHTVCGAKPMALSSWFLVNTPESLYLRGSLSGWFAFQAVVGKNSATRQWVKLGRKQSGVPGVPGELSRRDEFYVKFDTSRLHMLPKEPGSKDLVPIKAEQYFLNKAFLCGRTSQRDFPELYKDISRVWTLYRFSDALGQGNYIVPNSLFEDDLRKESQLWQSRGMECKVPSHVYRGSKVDDNMVVVKNYDWKLRLDMVVLFTCGEVLKEQYEGVADWKAIPVQCTFAETNVIADSPGPTESSAIYYLGEVDAAGKFTADADLITHAQRDNLKPLHALFASPEKTQRLLGVPLGKKRAVFAAHIRPQYESLRGKTLQALRPFGYPGQNGIEQKPGKEAGSFVIHLKNIQSAGDSGLNVGSPDRLVLSQPKDYMAPDAPWLQKGDVPIKGVTDRNVTFEEVKEWIEKQGSITSAPYAIALKS